MAKHEVRAVAPGEVVGIHFTMRNEDGRVLETTKGEEPLHYLHGAGGIPPGLERALVGQLPGNKLHLRLPPEDAYGVASGNPPQPVPRAEFPEDMPLEEGVPFHAELNEGEMVILWIGEVTEDTVYVSMDHPLAGEELDFDVEVISVRPASDEELQHGHAHEGDHHHH